MTTLIALVVNGLIIASASAEYWAAPAVERAAHFLNWAAAGILSVGHFSMLARDAADRPKSLARRCLFGTCAFSTSLVCASLGHYLLATIWLVTLVLAAANWHHKDKQGANS